MDFPEIALLISLSFAVLALTVLAIWVFLTAPRVPSRCTEKYKTTYYAHRGLHGNGAVENSLTAFARAVDAGFGIELDIRLSASGELVVFHDDSLNRVCGVDKKVIDLTLDELRTIRLSGTEDTVPSFSEVLELVDGRVPLLIEIKLYLDESGVAERFLEEIKDYKGEYIVESFTPWALKTVRRARPDIPLGMLSAAYMKEEKYRGHIGYRFLERLRFNFFARPDFIAYRSTDSEVLALRLLRKIYHVPTFAWTVKSREEEIEARKCGFDTVIFENYIPDKN